MMKATNEQIIESYKRLGSVWEVAKEFGMCGQSVHERTRRLGFVDPDKWTEEQLIILRNAYQQKDGPVNINELAKSLRRNQSNICRKARELGLATNKFRKRTPEVCQQIGKRTKEWLKHNPHPKGAYKTGKEIRICPRCNRFFDAFPSSKQVFCGRKCGNNHSQLQGNQGYAKSGKRSDLGGQYFRSRYEANYARYLNFIMLNDKSIVRWEFEPETFEFKKIKKGTRFYTPDFKVYFQDGRTEYHEVKGWDYPKGRTARKRFAKYFPHLTLLLIDSEWFRAAKKQGIDKLIPEWEGLYGSPPRIELEMEEDK